MALSIGTVVAGYTIEAVLGSGGMGTVYRATHPSLPRRDALKVLSEEFSRDDEIRTRFLREADLASTLDHPNIVAVYDRGETDDGRLWIAMQYVAGSDADRETRNGSMTPQRAVRIIGEVAAGLDYAHRRHIVHRDIKPANFLLAANDERVFLADFGIARALDDAVGLTRAGTVMASIAYTAPECLKAIAVDHRADIYSLGCALYHLLTGKAPFFRSREGGMAGVAAAHLFEAPPKVTELVPTLPAGIDAVVAKAMAKEPDDRYQSATELAAAATQALAGNPGPGSRTQPWHTAPPLPVPRPRKSGRRRGLIIGVLALVAVIVAVVTGLLLFRGPDEPAYQAQIFRHVHGSTEVTAAPRAVAALGPGDADAVLSLGVQPVAMTAPNGRLPSWEQSAVKGNPAVLSAIDTNAVAAASPDLILATGDIDDATFRKLAEIAPTVTRPADNATWDWQSQLTWAGRILGQQPKAEQLIDSIGSLQTDLRNQNPDFDGKTIEAVTISDAGVAEVLTQSFAADYLESLGFRYNPDLVTTPVDTGSTRPVTDLTRIYSIETDVLVLIRTDASAGNGGYAGLPQPFSTYSGRMAIFDGPDAVAAFADPGGYLATKYLDDNFVSTLKEP